LIAGTVDTTDRWRTRLREALAANDPGAIRDVARRVPVDDLAPATVILLDSILTRIGDRKAAFDLLEHAREKHPSDFWINLRLAQHHWLARPPRLEEAARFFHIALVLRPDHVGIMNDLGNALKDQGKFPEAMALYRKAIRLRPDDIYPRLNLSEALRVQGKLQEAEREARRAVDVKSGHPLPHWNLAGMLFYQGRYADAEAEYRLALRLLGDVPDPVTAADIHYGLGVLLHEQDRTREAEDELREALRVQPRLGTACYRLGGVLTDQGRWPEAAAMYQKALQYEGEQGLTYLNLGHCLIRLGRTDEGASSCAADTSWVRRRRTGTNRRRNCSATPSAWPSWAAGSTPT